jgi:predicted Fe-Mo cluster-binding NifX family protein
MQNYGGTLTWVAYGEPTVGQNGFDLILSVEDNLLYYQLTLPATEIAAEAYYVRIMDADNTCMYSCSVWSDSAYKDHMWALTESGTYDTVEVRSYTDEDTVLARWTLSTPIVVTAGESTLPANLALKAVDKTEDGTTVAYQLDGADSRLAYSIYDAAQSCVYTMEYDRKWGTDIVWMCNPSETVELYSLCAAQTAAAYTLDISAPSVLTVPAAQTDLVIIQQPESVETAIGQKFSVNFQVQGDGLTYQWYYKDAGMKSFAVSSNRTSAYAYTMVSYMHNRQVYCVITDQYGNQVTTDVATITRPPVELKILEQPESVEVAIGQKFSVSPKMQGDGLTYQWYYKDKGMREFKPSSNKSSAYAYTMVSYMHNRQVYCVITDQYGNQVTTDVATITRPPVELKILEQPGDVEVAIGQKFSVSPKMQGDGLTYQWYYKDKGMREFKPSSNKSSAYAYTMASYMHNRQVYCVITDQYGNQVTTDVATITRPPVELKLLSQPTDVYASKGEKFSVNFQVQGDGLTYQWYYKESYQKNFSVSSNKTSAYAYSMQSYMNGRSVYCVITDQYGNQVTTEVVTIHVK